MQNKMIKKTNNECQTSPAILMLNNECQASPAILMFSKRMILSLLLALMLISLAGCGDTGKEASPSLPEPIPTQASSDEGSNNAGSDGNDQEALAGENNTGNEARKNDENVSSSDGTVNDQEQTPEKKQDTGSSAPQNNYAPQSDTELSGDVKTIGAESFVVRQHFEIPTDSEEETMIVAPAEGSEDEVLITVHISADTVYEIRTVKNGGVNGDSDVEKKEGSFADIQEKASITSQGHYENGDFWADEITIYRYV